MNGQLVIALVGGVIGGISGIVSLLYSVFDFRDRFLKKMQKAHIALLATSQEAIIQRSEIESTALEKYPTFRSINPYVAEIQMILINFGDLIGYIRVLNIQCHELDKLRFSPVQGKDYTVIQGKSVHAYNILLRNIPAETKNPMPVTLDVSFEWGGVDRKGKEFIYKSIPSQVLVTLRSS